MIRQTNELHFPIEWEFRIIVAEAAMNEAMAGIARIFGEHETRIERGSSSRNGQYTTIKAKLRIDAREELDRFSRELLKVEGVRFLL